MRQMKKNDALYKQRASLFMLRDWQESSFLELF